MQTQYTLIFDLGGVFFTDGTDRAINVISERYSIDKKAVTEIFHGETGTMYRENKISMQMFWEIAKEKWRIENEPTNTLVNIWHEGYIPIEGTCDIIKVLKNKGYEILYFSGSTKDRVDYLENKYHFKQYFNDGIFSFSIYSRKPALESYQQILKTASNIPQYCIYIDNHEKYLIPARQLGMCTILFTTSSNLLITLNDLNIL